MDGTIQNTEFHSRRFQNSFQKFYWQAPSYGLFDGITIPKEFQQGKVKLRISYHKSDKKYVFTPYVERKLETLKLVFDDSVDYDLKFEERSQLNQLFDLRDNRDDVLIVKNGNITDTTYANIVFWDGETWFTPDTYLLKGTKRSQLLNQGTIHETQIRLDDLSKYKGFQLVNAMLDFNRVIFHPITGIDFSNNP